jgi:hypothetical protein
LTKRLPLARGVQRRFFGAIDLYQAVASFAGLFPTALFAYKPADDVLQHRARAAARRRGPVLLTASRVRPAATGA